MVKPPTAASTVKFKQVWAPSSVIVPVVLFVTTTLSVAAGKVALAVVAPV
jgi:hypothetical protein